MNKAVLLAIILASSTGAYALHELDNPDLQGNPITEETQPGSVPGGNLQKGKGDAFSSITENPPPTEEKSWWDKTTDTMGDWWSDEE